MVKRLLVISLIATVLVVTRAGEASACSCASITPSVALEEADAAFVGTLIDRPVSEMTFVEDAPYTFEVESWVKGDFGSEVVVHAPNQGSACGIEAPVGQRVGLFVHEQNGEFTGSLCSMVDPDLLLAGDTPLAIDGAGPPVFLVAGYDGPARLMLIDASGGLVAAIGAEDQYMNGLALCPGSERVVELMNDQLVVRATVDLTEIRRVDLDNLPYERAVPRIWCRDVTGDTAWLSIDNWTESGGSMIRHVDAADVGHPILEGPYEWLEVGDQFAVGGEGPTSKTIWRIDLETGENTLLHEIPMKPGDSEPSGKAMATADGTGWVDDHTFAAYSYPDMNIDIVDYLFIDTVGETIAHLSEIPGWQVFRVGDDLSGVMGAHLNVIPIDGGPVGELRLLPSEMHRLAAVLQPEAKITGRTVVAPPADPGGTTSSDSSQAIESPLPWSAIAAAAGLLLAALVGIFLWRRSSAS